MIRKGQTIQNPVTGERMTFLETSAETRGEWVLIELRAEPGGAVAASHVHPAQGERFEVVSGRLGVKTGRTKVELGPGESISVKQGQAHTWWNAGDDELVFRCEIRPARQFESLIETMFSLAADGKTNKKGMPNPFRLAVIANAHFDTVQLPLIPAWMQKVALATGAPLGKALGYGPTYEAEPQAQSPLVAAHAQA